MPAIEKCEMLCYGWGKGGWRGVGGWKRCYRLEMGQIFWCGLLLMVVWSTPPAYDFNIEISCDAIMHWESFPGSPPVPNHRTKKNICSGPIENRESIYTRYPQRHLYFFRHNPSSSLSLAISVERDKLAKNRAFCGCFNGFFFRTGKEIMHRWK